MDDDRLGDACDADLDGDGWSNGEDNCPSVANPDQTDRDRDRIGAACDPDDAEDPVCEPGRTQECRCANGVWGEQVCLPGGDGWDECLCDDPPLEGCDALCALVDEVCPDGELMLLCGDVCPPPVAEHPEVLECLTALVERGVCDGPQVRHCIEGPPDPRCVVDLECEAGMVCLDGDCVPEGTCRGDFDCPDGQLCEDDECVPAGVCLVDDDCQAGEECVVGECVPAGGDCPPDRFEPNDDARSAAEPAVRVWRDLSICAGDEDWFATEVVQGERFSASIDFQHARGDLDMELLIGNVVLVSSDSTSDGELVEFEFDDDYTTHVRVRGYQGATNDYDLTFGMQD